MLKTDPDQVKNEENGKAKEQEPTIIRNTMARIRRNKQATDRHNSGYRTHNPIT